MIGKLILLLILRPSQSFIIDKQYANQILSRTRRNNNGMFEELTKKGNFERECIEEICHFHEYKEIFKQNKNSIHESFRKMSTAKIGYRNTEADSSLEQTQVLAKSRSLISHDQDPNFLRNYQLTSEFDFTLNQDNQPTSRHDTCEDSCVAPPINPKTMTILINSENDYKNFQENAIKNQCDYYNHCHEEGTDKCVNYNRDFKCNCHNENIDDNKTMVWSGPYCETCQCYQENKVCGKDKNETPICQTCYEHENVDEQLWDCRIRNQISGAYGNAILGYQSLGEVRVCQCCPRFMEFRVGTDTSDFACVWPQLDDENTLCESRCVERDSNGVKNWDCPSGNVQECDSLPDEWETTTELITTVSLPEEWSTTTASTTTVSFPDERSTATVSNKVDCPKIGTYQLCYEIRKFIQGAFDSLKPYHYSESVDRLSCQYHNLKTTDDDDPCIEYFHTYTSKDKLRRYDNTELGDVSENHIRICIAYEDCKDLKRFEFVKK